MDSFSTEIYTFYIFKYLDGKDLSYLRATSKFFNDFISKEDIRIKNHYIYFNSVYDIPYMDDLSILLTNQEDKIIDWLFEIGFKGEGCNLCTNNKGRIVYFNNWYTMHPLDTSYWTPFIDALKDFRWKLIEFPPLLGIERRKVVGGMGELHRGACIYVSWDKREKKRLKV